MIKRFPKFLLSLAVFCCFLFCAAMNAQNVFRLDSLKGEITLDKDWRFHSGDNKEWANPAFDDRAWDTVSLSKINLLSLADDLGGTGWLRLHLKVSPALFHKTVILQVYQHGASEVYLNNNLIETFGRVGDIQTEIPYDPGNNIYYIQLGGDTMQVMAVHYSQNKTLKSKMNVTFLSVLLANPTMVNEINPGGMSTESDSLLIFAVFLTLSIFHFLLFIYYRKARSNLYYSVFALLIAYISLSPFLELISHSPEIKILILEVDYYLIAPCFFLIVVLLYNIFDRKLNWFFWILIALTGLSELAVFMKSYDIYYILTFTQTCSASCSGIVMIIKALRKKKTGAWIIASGFLVFLSLIPGMVLFFTIGSIVGHGKVGMHDNSGIFMIMLVVWIFSIPVSMSVYLASDFARTNKKLSMQLVHVKQLSEQNMQKEIEKKQIIENQKEMLETQVKEKTSEIQEQKNELLQKNTEIIDSILYARRIQTAILPTDEMLKQALGDYLVIFLPKDVVSGDLYWCHVYGEIVVFAVADCTGHGVPGALMSMVGNSLLNEVVMDGKAYEADLILNELRKKLITTLQQNVGHSNRDGMDISLCVWNKKDNTLQYAGANNRLYRISENITKDATIQQSENIKLYNNHLLEIVGDKQPIGYQEGKMDVAFTKHSIQLRKGDIIYITSDGYIDQFGGNKNKKFTSKRLRDLLETFVNKPIDNQRMSLVQTIDDWRKDETQTDDICVLGVRI